MRLRFSSAQRRDEVIFYADNQQSFVEQAILAAREFRTRHHRKVHKGQVKKNVLWFDSATAGMYDDSNRQWYNPGRIGTTDTGLRYYEPITFELPWSEADSLDQMFSRDEFLLRVNGDQLWQQFCDTYRWGLALQNMVGELGDQLSEAAQ